MCRAGRITQHDTPKTTPSQDALRDKALRGKQALIDHMAGRIKANAIKILEVGMTETWVRR